MIGVIEARNIILSKCQALAPELTPLAEAYNHFVAEDIVAQLAMPPFAQSAMDGYAFRFDDLSTFNLLKVDGEVAAGDSLNQTLTEGCAIRIFTGAPLPIGADTVVMQEKVNIIGSQLLFMDSAIQCGSNVRAAGSHISVGQTLIKRGLRLTPAAVGLLASAGCDKVLIHPYPSVAILVSGNELTPPGESLQHGHIYESNSFTLDAVLKENGIQAAIAFCGDHLEETKQSISTFQNKDILLISGGISVGDYDFILPALKELDYEIYFHKVKQKPGKPFCFAGKNNQLVFALPGNPASVLTCFYEYVLPAIATIKGTKDAFKTKQMLPLKATYTKKSGLTHFLKGMVNNGAVEILQSQESYKLDSFSMANCLVVIPEESEGIEKGTLVEIHPISTTWN